MKEITKYNYTIPHLQLILFGWIFCVLSPVLNNCCKCCKIHLNSLTIHCNERFALLQHSKTLTLATLTLFVARFECSNQILARFVLNTVIFITFGTTTNEWQQRWTSMSSGQTQNSDLCGVDTALVWKMGERVDSGDGTVCMHFTASFVLDWKELLHVQCRKANKRMESDENPNNIVHQKKKNRKQIG